MRRLLACLAGVGLAAYWLVVVWWLPTNFWSVSVTLHEPTGPHFTKMETQFRPSWLNETFDSFAEGRHVHAESHIAWVSPKGVTLRIRVQEFMAGHPVFSVEKLVFVPPDQPVRVDLSPACYLTSNLDSP